MQAILAGETSARARDVLRAPRPHRDRDEKLAWSGYCSQFRDKEIDVEYEPAPADVTRDLSQAVYELRVNSVVQTAALFEAYVQCWALNMLLARLEDQSDAGGWTPAQEKLAGALSPMTNSGRFLPPWRSILKAFPHVPSELATMAPTDGDVGRTAALGGIGRTDMNLYGALLGWCEFRNLAVHRSRRVSKPFLNSNKAFVEMLKKIPGIDMDDFSFGQLMPLSFELTRAMRYAFRRTAEAMEAALFSESAGARGSAIKGPCVSAASDPTDGDDVLLRVGDDEPSLQWVCSHSSNGRWDRLPE